MINRQIGFVILVLFGLGVFAGCTTQKATVNVPRENMRKQMALQRHMQKLNRQNAKLQKILKESSIINIETADALDQTPVNEEQIPELNRMLQEYVLINRQTQAALDSFEKTIEDDIQKNRYIDEQLDGFAIECRQQKDRLGRIRDGMSESESDQWISDNVHIGISSQMFQGNGTIASTETIFEGMTSTAYFTYVGAYDTSIGLKYMILDGKLADREASGFSGDDFFDHDLVMSFFSLGFRIPTVETFNIVPELLYGAGKGKLCEGNSNCSEDTYVKSDFRALGIEIPFYHHLSSVFSWGFKFSGYRYEADRREFVVDGSTVATVHDPSMMTMFGAGVMIGLAW